MSHECLPNFLIVGAAKAGTTTVWRWLIDHPDVFLPKTIKEPSYFVDDYGMSNWDDYLALFRGALNRKRIGEASAAYLAAPESPMRIRETLGNVKIIILLRNPIARAYSLYNWMVMEGFERITNFADAVRGESDRYCAHFAKTAPQYAPDFWYVRTGFYSEQVRRYLDLFDTKVMLFDDMISRPVTFFKELCAFLEISDRSATGSLPRNASKVPRSIALQYWLRSSRDRIRHRFPRSEHFLSAPIKVAMRINRDAGTRFPMPANVAHHLARTYSSDVAILGEMLGRDLSHWLSVP